MTAGSAPVRHDESGPIRTLLATPLVTVGAFADPRGDACEWFSVRDDVLRDVVARHDPDAPGREGRIFALTHGPSDAGSYVLQRQVVRHVLASREPDRLALEETVLGVLGRVLALARGARWPGSKGGTASRADPDRIPGARTPGGSGPGEGVHSGANSASRSGTPLAEAVRRHLRGSFRLGLSLDEIAEGVGVSVYHMCREFRGSTGTTIHRYRNELRLRRSLELVAERNGDLTGIALRLGYCSHSHFTASFRRAFRTTPSDFRRHASSRKLRELAERLGGSGPSPIRG